MPLSFPQMLTCSTPADDGGTCAGRIILDQPATTATVRDIARAVGWQIDETAAGRVNILVEAGARTATTDDVCPSCRAGNPPIRVNGSCLNCGAPAAGGWCVRCTSQQPI